MSAQILKQLKIKTATLKRLRKQHESYDKEVKGIQCKITKLQQDLNATNDEEAQVSLKKNKQFLIESQSVLSNVKQKLIQAFEGLAQYLSENGQTEGVDSTQEKNQAENVLLSVETFLQNLG